MEASRIRNDYILGLQERTFTPARVQRSAE